ncbi:hypothetical protein PtB15_7B801 [Puccinia triticina]|nr:hypothetical protein PtB15_7B801 [Puccinia triticina]
MAKKKVILDRLINAENTSNNPSLAPPTSEKDQSSRPPTSENYIEYSDEDESKQDDSDKSDGHNSDDGDSNFDPTQTQTGAHEEPKFPLHPDLAFL